MITIERWARGAVLALAATLAFASVGCQASTDSESDDDEYVAAAEQELDPADGEEQTQGGGIDPGGDCEAGEENKDPQPQPWRNGMTNSSSKPGPDPVDPSSRNSVVAPH